MKSHVRRVHLAIGAACAVLAVTAVFWLHQSGAPDRLRTWVQSWRSEPADLPPRPVTKHAPANLQDLAPALRVKLETALRDPEAVFGGFESWTRRYLLARDDAQRAALVSEGIAAATERRAVLFELIAVDPELALRCALPWTTRSALPREVNELLEERVSGVGDFSVLAARPTGEADEQFRAVRRDVTLEGRSFDTFVYGRRANLITRRGIALHGIAVDGRLALLDSPVRVLDPGEPPADGRNVEELCAVSGVPAGPNRAEPDQPVIGVDTGDRVYYLCSAGHIALLEDSRFARETNIGAATGGAGSATAAAEATTGTKRVLLIRVRFADQAAVLEPQSETSARAMFDEAGAFLAENSFGALALEPFVTPVYTLPQSAAWYQSHDTSGYALNVLQAARDVAARPQDFANNDGLPAFNYLDHDFEAVRYTGGPGAFSGQAYVGVRGLWLKSSGAGVLAHELGHNLGLWHANAWASNDPQATAGPGVNREYGDTFDTMGSASAGAWHFNTYEKHALGWLADANVETAYVSGIFRVYAHDLGGARDAARRYALRVPRDEDRDYWFELRQHAGWAQNPWITQGLGARWDPWTQSNGGTQLLDTTPLSADGRNDSAILIGRTYSDPVANIHVTPLAKSGTSPEALDVDVRIGPFPDNHVPTVALAASGTTAAVGAVVSFTATASDSDGDTLAYAWDFGDRLFGPNAAAATHAWTTAGDFRVRVTASDRKGGVATASVMVRVGAPAGALVRGTITDMSGKPVPDVRVSTAVATSDPAYREALTDSDGTFALTNVAHGSWFLLATKPGWAFAPAAFANPLEVTGDVSRVDFAGRVGGWRVTGVVRYADGSPVRGALVSDGTRGEPTAADGTFALVGVPAGTYTLNATKDGTSFVPVRVEVAYADVVAATINETTYTLSGQINGADSNPITVTDGWRATTAYRYGVGPAARSVFTLTGVPAGTWHLRAWRAGAEFAPVSFANPLAVTGDRYDLVFAQTGTATTFAIAGRVTDRGEGLAGVSVQSGSQSTTTDSRGAYVLENLASGTHVVSVTASGIEFTPANRTVVVSSADVAGIDFTSTRVNAAPRITQAARAVAPFNRPFVKLSVRADDDGGAERLRYTWTALGPTPAPVSFSLNGAQAARDTVASFAAAGTYQLRVTATDVAGASVTSDVSVTIQPTLARITIAPAITAVAKGAQQTFALSCLDQFGGAMSTPGGVVWSTSGGGAISGAGVFGATTPGANFIVSARIGDLAASAVVDVHHPAGPGYGLLAETWNNVTGSQVRDLTNLAAFPDRPATSEEWIGPLELNGDLAGQHNYGRRLRGFFVPPASGDYIFSIASNNASELWLSSSPDPTGRVLIASAPVATGVRQWNALASQRSVPVHLLAGASVYLEVLHKEDAADDHVSVAVELPGGVVEGPIPGHRLLPWGASAFGPPRIVSPAQASPTLVGSNLSTSLAVLATSDAGENSLSYAWTAVGNSPGPAVVLPNGTNASKNATVHFSQPGRYTMRVRVTDAAGQSAESTVAINVEETLSTWRNRFFTGAELGNAALAETRWGDNADPDGDGVVNLLEYAFALDPLVPGTTGTPQPSFVSVDGVEYLAITFRRNTAATDLVFTPQATSDLKTWEIGLIAVGDPNGETVTYRDFAPASNFEQRFLRVEVTGP